MRRPKPLPDPMIRFWSYVDKGVSTEASDDDECWKWTGACTPQGYGVFWAEGKSVVASRFLYEREHGRLDAALHVCHRCDNPPCVRLTHLFAGTVKDNIDDAIAKGRFDRFRITRTPRARGEGNGQHTLTTAQVLLIRQLYKPGRAGHKSSGSFRSLAARFGVSKFAIQYVVKHGWRHLSEVVNV